MKKFLIQTELPKVYSSSIQVTWFSTTLSMRKTEIDNNPGYLIQTLTSNSALLKDFRSGNTLY